MLFPLNMMIAVFQQRPITGIWIMYVDLAAIVLGAVLMYGVMKKSILAGKNVGAWTILGCFVVFVVWLSFRCVDVMNGRWGSVFWKY